MPGFYRNLNIISKLTLGYSVVLFFCCLIGFFGFKGMSEIKSRVDDMQQHVITKLSTITSFDRQIQVHRRTLLHFLINPDKNRREILSSRLAYTEQKAKEAFSQLELIAASDAEHQLISEIKLLYQQYFAIADAVHDKAATGTAFHQLGKETELTYTIFIKLDELSNQLIALGEEEAAKHHQDSADIYYHLCRWLFVLFTFSILLALLMAAITGRSISAPVQTALTAIRRKEKRAKENARLAESIAAGDLDQEVIIDKPLAVDSRLLGNNEAGMLLRAVAGMSESQCAFDAAFDTMTRSLRKHREEETIRTWYKNGLHELGQLLQGEKSPEELTSQVLSFLASHLEAGVGLFYLYSEKDNCLHRVAGYALTDPDQRPLELSLGEGLAGQAAKEQKLFCRSNLPSDYLQIGSGLGKTGSTAVAALPFIHNKNLMGVLELGSLYGFTEQQTDFLQQTHDSIAIALNVNRSRQIINDLLSQTQTQAEELRVSQEELQQTNEELEERAQVLEQQRNYIRNKNQEIEEQSHELLRKSEELERISKYKSEFLANMSHELRTPLNSLLILSGLLRDNKDGNLTEKQMEFAATINNAGRDLLALINDILDLSKIESGHLEFHFEEISPAEICAEPAAFFTPLSMDKEVGFTIDYAENLPEIIITDGQRVGQILKNLLSNAFKFTSKGEVKLKVFVPKAHLSPIVLPAIAFAVSDTGIGIAEDKQALIFNAFQQEDGSTSRTYGGTGLGLSISRQLARSMGGEISLESVQGSGSTFTLFLPLKSVSATEKPQPSSASVQPLAQPAAPATTQVNEKHNCLPVAPMDDDRELLQNGERSVLIIEDDPSFASILRDMVRSRGFKAIVAVDGESGIDLAQHFRPDAVILDVMLPHIDGWGVMRILKDNPETRHIPVHFITCLEEKRKAMNMGAVGFVTKPVNSQQLEEALNTLTKAMDKTMKMLLIVEDDPNQAKAMTELLDAGNVTIKVAPTGGQALSMLTEAQFDCIVLDLGLADMGAFEMLEELKKLDPERRIPVIIHTGRELTREDERKLHHYAESIIIKGVKSPERLLNEVTLFLHLIETTLDIEKQRMIRSALDKEAMLSGKKVLIVDDDMRNIFSLSSALAEKDMIIIEAENGKEALRQLEHNPDTNLILMDIMMPEMDGYEAMRLIRTDERFKSLPIIALTAKAMKGDREDCLKAGASDYISKPVELDKLFSLLRVWLYSASATEI